MAHRRHDLWLLIRLAAQNVGRRRLRAVFLSAAVMLGVGIAFAGFVAGWALRDGMATSFSRMGADLVVVPRATLVNITSSLLTVQPTDETLPADLAQRIAAISGVGQVAPQRIVPALVQGNATNLIAFDPARDLSVLTWLVERQPGPVEGLIAGGGLAARLGESVSVCGMPMRIYGRLGKTGVGPFDDSYFLSFGALADMVSFCRTSEARGAPTKLGGGTYAVNLETGRALAWISYWNYGDYNPISHHLCAFPSADPAKGFEWINSTQGGKNALIYGIPTNIETPGEGFNIYRVRYDGAQMELMENVAESTGLGLGVHVTIDPKAAERYFVTDGQKDIAACFDRRTSRVIAAIKYDWVPNVRNLAEGWQKGGTLKISRIYPDPKTGKYDYLGTKGQKIEWEMVPMGELFVEEGTIPGDDVHGLCGADGTIWHPSGRWASTVVRLCGGQVILDAEKNFEPVAFLQFNKDAPNQYPIKKIDNDHWEVTFDKIFSPGHEVGFSPDGRFLCMMNNLRENNCSVFDSSDPDPRNWKKIAHIDFSIDSSKLYLSILHPSPASSGVMVVDTNTWKIKKEIQGIGPDMQTLAITYDGKYVVGVFSGFQRLSSGIAFIDAETDELVGIWPSNGGHHDCVIIPTQLEHMKHTRSCTL